MSDFGGQSGSEGASREELLQRIARLEGAMGERRSYSHRPWWMCWLMVWLVISLFRGFGGWGWGWGGHCIWPSGILMFVVVMCVLREIRWHRGSGGRTW